MHRNALVRINPNAIYQNQFNLFNAPHGSYLFFCFIYILYTLRDGNNECMDKTMENFRRMKKMRMKQRKKNKRNNESKE